MAKRIRWAAQALEEKKSILAYWNQRNGSKTFSKKLNRFFRKNLDLAARYPSLGKPTDMEEVRMLTVLDYLLFYQTDTDYLYVLCLWDSRRDPEKLEERMQEE